MENYNEWMHMLIVEISVKWKTDGLFHCISDSNINKFATSLLLNCCWLHYNAMEGNWTLVSYAL